MYWHPSLRRDSGLTERAVQRSNQPRAKRTRHAGWQTSTSNHNRRKRPPLPTPRELWSTLPPLSAHSIIPRVRYRLEDLDTGYFDCVSGQFVLIVAFFTLPQCFFAPCLERLAAPWPGPLPRQWLDSSLHRRFRTRCRCVPLPNTPLPIPQLPASRSAGRSCLRRNRPSCGCS